MDIVQLQADVNQFYADLPQNVAPLIPVISVTHYNTFQAPPGTLHTIMVGYVLMGPGGPS